MEAQAQLLLPTAIGTSDAVSDRNRGDRYSTDSTSGMETYTAQWFTLHNRALTADRDHSKTTTPLKTDSYELQLREKHSDGWVGVLRGCS